MHGYGIKVSRDDNYVKEGIFKNDNLSNDPYIDDNESNYEF